MASPDPDWPSAELARLAPPLRSVGADLLLYKALFLGPAFTGVARLQSEPRAQEVLLAIAADTDAEARTACAALAEWNDLRLDLDALDEKLRAALLGDLLSIKEGTSEAFLLVAMRAPTNPMRLALVELADAERRHADALRGLLGMDQVDQRLRGRPRPAHGVTVGVHESRFPDASLGQSIQRVIDEMRADGQELSRLTLSALALRHARDEGIMGAEDGTLFGLSVYVDFGWRGECFAVHTQDHASLAQIITASRTTDRDD